MAAMISPCRVAVIASAAVYRRDRTPAMVFSGTAPVIAVRLPCGSASTIRTRAPSFCNPVAIACAVVVLPVPPFCDIMAMVYATLILKGKKQVSDVPNVIEAQVIDILKDVLEVEELPEELL